MADQAFADGPILRNELVNRRTLSAAAAAARRTLLEAMLDPERRCLPTLGMGGTYPPERSIYESLLRASGLHGKTADDAGETEGRYEFRAPDPAHDPARLSPTWAVLSQMLLDRPLPEPVPLPVLLDRLSRAPLGITEGVFPILLCAFLIVHEGEISFYREGTFVPEPGIADWEVLIRRPELFALAGCRVEGARAVVVARFAQKLGCSTVGVVPVVRALMKMAAFATRLCVEDPAVTGSGPCRAGGIREGPRP